MAEGPADLSLTDLRERILQVLRDAGSPVKTDELQKKCNVPKKRLNQVLYQMKKKQLVVHLGLATWGSSGHASGEVVPTEPAGPSQAEKHQQVAAVAPERPGFQLSEPRAAIYRLLEDGRPWNALNIAKALGKKTAKDVNPDLYAMREEHLLDYDKNSKAWTVYRPEGSGGRSQSAAIIYQQNPINMICQTGPNGRIAIENAKAVQIGYGNVMKREAEDSDIAIRNSTAVQIGYRNVMAMTEENGESADRHQEQTLRGQGRGAFDPLRSRVLSGHQGPPRWPSRERGQLPSCPDQSCPAFPHILTPFASFSVGPDTFP
uniref:Z-DNA binding protein 1 n=1 Tax=Rousettus aegyptiacus TaxID=9407 RepID=A0A7J8DLZ2_ROUAE|nr:Z-DNA binding protein 1 [Rousettus aegyptiacus]